MREYLTISTLPSKAMAVRKRSSAMTPTEKNTFRRVLRRLIKSAGDPNEYGIMVEHHSNMMHNMHGSMGLVGEQRFLPWHRVYLLKLEQMGQAIDSAFFIPYWDWTTERRIPTWLKSFRPRVKVTGPNIPIVRNPGPGSQLPSPSQINSILGRSTFTQFTRSLEQGPHNFVHVWFNGTMSDLRTAPADALFWLHHANIDRIWSIWQGSHSGLNPSLSGTDQTIDPWPETEQQVRSISSLGYSYGA